MSTSAIHSFRNFTPFMLLLCCLLMLELVGGKENTLARTPPMGFLTWERFRCITDCVAYPDDCISEKLILTTAKIMKKEGYLGAGYNFIIIDDCWAEINRSKDGKIMEDRTRFPSGMKALSNSLKLMGFKFGIYADIGSKTCEGYPGMQGHMESDMQVYKEFGAEFIKVDGCHINKSQIPDAYIQLSNHMSKNNQDMVLSCSWPAYTDSVGREENYKLISRYCNTWRSFDDIQDSASSLWSIVNHYTHNQAPFSNSSGPGAWNDADMLIVGGYGISIDMQRVQMALWCIMPSVLMISAKLSEISVESRKILLNRLAISINQDYLGIPGRYIGTSNKLDIWCRPISSGLALALVSKREDFPFKFSLVLSLVGLRNGIPVIVEDVFGGKKSTVVNYLDLTVNPQGVVFIKVTVPYPLHELGLPCFTLKHIYKKYKVDSHYYS